MIFHFLPGAATPGISLDQEPSVVSFNASHIHAIRLQACEPTQIPGGETVTAHIHVYLGSQVVHFPATEPNLRSRDLWINWAGGWSVFKW
jgi:hypothetical protein